MDAQLMEVDYSRGAERPSSACKRKLWCVHQVGHAGDCEPTFDETREERRERLETEAGCEGRDER